MNDKIKQLEQDYQDLKDKYDVLVRINGQLVKKSESIKSTKSARQLFEELGYKCSKRSGYIEYEWEDESENHYKTITFCTLDEMFHADQDYDSMYMDMKTFKAIHKQIEELGWLND